MIIIVYYAKIDPDRMSLNYSFLFSPLEDLKCLLGVVYPLVP